MQARARADERFQAVVAEELGLLKGEVARCVRLCACLGGVWMGGGMHEQRRAQANRHIRTNRPTKSTREAQARVREDDEIIEALGRYTSKLQLSLRIINSAATEHE